MNSQIIAYILQGLLAVACFSSIPIVVRLISADPWTIGFVRLIITVLVGYFVLVPKNKLKSLTYRDWFWLMVFGLFFSLHWVTYFISIKMANASTAVIGISSYGVQLILISILFHGRSFYRTDALAIVVVIIGELLVVPDFSLNNEYTQGFLIAIMSAFFYAVLPSLHQMNSHIDSGTRAYGQFLFASIFFSLFLPKMSFDLSGLDWAGLVYLAIIATLLAHSLWVKVTTRVAAVPASLMYYLSIPAAVFLSVIVLNESITWQLVIGILLILIGNFFGIVHQAKKKSFFIDEPAKI